jgi:hypothetical protein
MRDFHDLLKEKPSSLFMLPGCFLDDMVHMSIFHDQDTGVVKMYMVTQIRAPSSSVSSCPVWDSAPSDTPVLYL